MMGCEFVELILFRFSVGIVSISAISHWEGLQYRWTSPNPLTASTLGSSLQKILRFAELDQSCGVISLPGMRYLENGRIGIEVGGIGEGDSIALVKDRLWLWHWARYVVHPRT